MSDNLLFNAKDSDCQKESAGRQHLHYDIVIAGGGLAGLSIAAALSFYFSTYTAGKYKIAVVEAFNRPEEDYNVDNDPQTTAISYGSRLIYEKLGIWPLLKPYVQPIKHIHVSDRGHMGMAHINAEDHRQPALGYVIANKHLLHILTGVVSSLENVTICCPASITDLSFHPSMVQLSVQQQDALYSFSTELVILAEGGRSSLASGLGFQSDITSYEQTAIVATVEHDKKHNAVAFERFTDEGPVAMLPILSADQQKSTVIWTMPEALAEERLQLICQDFRAELQARFGYRLGAFTQVGDRCHFPLSLKTVSEPVRHGVVLSGNAAHMLHPVAGQGYNLTLRDAMVLAETLATAPDTQSLGDLTLLQKYQRAQAADQSAVMTFSDALAKYFSSGHLPLRIARNMGLCLLDTCLPLRKWFGKKAMGMGGYGQ